MKSNLGLGRQRRWQRLTRRDRPPELPLPAVASDLEQREEQSGELLALARLLRRFQGTFALAFARCNVVPLREQLVAALRAVLAPACVIIYEAELTPEMSDLPASLAAADGDGDPLFVYGLERVMFSGAPGWAQVQLNERRGLYQKLGRPLVFWLPRYALRLVAHGAPDFWAWRSGVYEFALPLAGREALLEREVQRMDWMTQWNLDQAAKEARLHLLRGMLDEYTGETVGKEGREGRGENRRARAETLRRLADLEITLVGYEAAEPHLREALHVYGRLGDRRGVAITQGQLARLLQLRGDYEEAERLYRGALEAWERLGDRRGVAVTHHDLAYLFRLHRDYEEAGRLYRAALETKERLGDRREVAVTQGQLADLLQLRGDHEGAERLYRAALETKERLGDRREVAVTQDQLARLLQLRGDYGEAERLYRAALRTLEHLGDRRGVAVTHHDLAELCHLRGDYEEAGRLYCAALETFERLGDRRGVAVTLLNLALLQRDQGRTEKALNLLARSRDINTALGLDKDIARAEEAIAGIHRSLEPHPPP